MILLFTLYDPVKNLIMSSITYKQQFQYNFKISDMGNSGPKKQIDEDHTEHERLGYVKLEANKIDPNTQEDEEETFIMHLKRSVESERIYNDWVKSMTQVDDSESKEVILLPLKRSFESVGLCGSSGIAKIAFDYYQFVLKTEILNRYKLRKDFLQTQIWYLLYNIVRAGNKFQLLKKKIGNIHPINILINESGQIKIISTISLPGELNNYESLLQNSTGQFLNVYLAPEEINYDLIMKGCYPTHVDPSLAEVFSIGLTILSSGTLQDGNTIYQRNPSDRYELNKERLSGLLRTFKQKYSDFLYQTVASMVALNPQDRKRCSAIAASLYEFEPQILDLQPFQIPNYRNTTSQRPSQIYQQNHQSYQPPQVYSQPPPPSQPLYYNYQQGPQPVTRTSYQGGSSTAPTTMYKHPYSHQQVVGSNYRNQI